MVSEPTTDDPPIFEIVSYRKSGLSLNHITGCPADCAYCIRLDAGGFDRKRPTLLLSDEEAVDRLVGHKYFTPDVTPLQIFNRTTDPFLPTVMPHTLEVLRQLARRGLTNHVLLITRYRIPKSACLEINDISRGGPRVTMLITYSGILDHQIEPLSSKLAEQSLRTASTNRANYKVILYWRPLIQGVNDSNEHISRARELAQLADATVFTGLFYRQSIRRHYQDLGIPEPYPSTARRKILPESLDRRVTSAFQNGPPLFRKTSCAVAYVHSMPDYNGHISYPAICTICPAQQIERCVAHQEIPERSRVEELLAYLSLSAPFSIEHDRIEISGLRDEDRYFLQHALRFQVHDTEHPHSPNLHGRSEVGWSDHGWPKEDRS
jgi:DNA repair photolyase